MLEINKLYNEDCLEGMKRIDDKSVDMIFTDLPYHTTQAHWDCEIDLDKIRTLTCSFLHKTYNRW